MQEQVNVVTPVYNGEHLIPRLLDSLLIQTYPIITMYVVDDGSTDNTRSVIEHYIPLFEQKGYKLCYIYQENGGQSAALNRGLKYVNGDYLLWPDADDWYKTPDAIEILVNTIRQTGDDVGIARCQLEFVDEETMEVTYSTAFSPCNTPCDLLEDAIYGANDFLYAPIEWIAKVKFLDKFIPKREIYTRQRAGQNAQLLLPYLGYSKCITIEKTLCCYLFRKNSSSHIKRTYELSLDYDEGHMLAFVLTLQNMNKLDVDKRDEYIKARRIFYYKHFFDYDYEFENIAGFRQHYRESLKYKLPISRRQRHLWIWTTLFGIKSYKRIGSIWPNMKKRFKRI